MTTIAQQLEQLEAEIRDQGEHPSVMLISEFIDWAGRLAAIRAEVGGEAVAEVGYHDTMMRLSADPLPVGTKLYAPPPAAVDVGALLELVNGWRNHALKWPREADKINLCADELTALIGKEA